MQDLTSLLSKSFNKEAIHYKALRELVNVTLKKQGPSKIRYVGANQAHSIHKKLSKEIMKRFQLRNRF